MKGGSDTNEKKSTVQPIGRNIIAILAAKNLERSHLPSSSNPPPGKREEGRKKKEKKTTEKNDKATSFGDFCADMGGDSPTPTFK